MKLRVRYIDNRPDEIYEAEDVDLIDRSYKLVYWTEGQIKKWVAIIPSHIVLHITPELDESKN